LSINGEFYNSIIYPHSMSSTYTDYSKVRLCKDSYNDLKGMSWPLYEEFIKLKFDELSQDIHDEIFQLNLSWKPPLESLPFSTVFYHQNFHFLLKHKFPDSDKIGEGYAHMWQDILVLTMSQGKKNGSFLEIGANSPTRINNTFLLEALYNWRGVSIDIVDYSNSWLIRPKSNFICADATELDYSKLLSTHFNEKQIDYLQIDFDDLNGHLVVLNSLLQLDYRFSIITLETRNSDNHKHVSLFRKTLLDNGYKLLVGDVEGFNPPSEKWTPLEDWYIDPNVINTNLVELFTKQGLTYKNPFFLFTDQ